MLRVPIRDLHSNKKVPARFCDVIIEDGQVFLEKKSGKNQYEKIAWEDVVYQVQAITASIQQKLPQPAP